MPAASAISPYTLLDSEPDQQPHIADEDETYDVVRNGGDVHLATVAEKKRLWWRTILINSLFVCCWFGFATLLSVYNKWMFSPDHYGFPAPLFVSAIQMFVQFALASLIRNLLPQHFKPDARPSVEDYIKKAAPTAITTGLDIGLSNLSLRAITLSFYTMCKSSSLIFVLGFAFLFGLEKFSFRLIGVIFLIFIGVVLMVATQTHFILDGFLLVTSASALSGLRWSLIQTLLKNKKMGMDSPPTTLFWLTPVMGLTLALVSFFVDSWSAIFQSKFFATTTDTLWSILFLLAPGIVAFSMVVSEFYVIQRAGVVPMSITAVAKEVATIMVSATVFGDQLTPLNITGVVITIGGISLYTYHKYRMIIESPVPLDAHGNPISDEEDIERTGSVALDVEGASSFELEETTSLVDSHSDTHVEVERHERRPKEVLFTVQDEDEEDGDRNGNSNDKLR